MVLDHKGFYLYISRSLVIHKIGNLTNLHNVPNICKLIYSFRMLKLEDLDDAQIYNYLYFFKFFFGRRSYLSEQKAFFSSGSWTYNISVNMSVTRINEIYLNLYILFNEYISSMDHSHIVFSSYKKVQNISYTLITDLNYFSEKKTNFGLFNLECDLLLRMYFFRESSMNKIFLGVIKYAN